MKRSKNNFCRRLGSRRYFLHKNQSRELYKKSHRASYKKLKNKRNLSADSCSLLLSALRPRLLNVRIFGTMPIRLSTLKVRKLGLRLAMPMAIITFMLIQNAEIAKVSAVSLELTVPTNFSVDLITGTENGFGIGNPSQIKIKTSAFFGYNLSIKAADDNTLKNGSYLLNPISKEYNSADDYKNATDNNNEFNTWAIKPSKWQNAENSKILPAPIKETVIEETDTSNGSDVSNNYNISLVAKVNNATIAGTYRNVFIFTATANTANYIVKYDLNGEGATGGPIEPITGSTAESTTTVRISTEKPVREGYDFMGWCTIQTSDENCTGETIAIGGDLTISNLKKDDDNTVTLWGIWKSSEPPLVNKGDLGDAQSFNCDTKLPDIHNYGTVKDTRDNSVYSVAKLMDGRCWMTQNLRIVGRTISSSNSDMTSGSFTIPSNDENSFYVGSNWNQPEKNTAYYGGDTNYGAWYTWFAATAGSGKSSYTEDGQNAPNSICPKGWRLPTGGENGEYQKLMEAYNIQNNADGIERIMAAPMNFVTAGSYDWGWYGNSHKAGYYSTSTVCFETNEYSFRFEPDNNEVTADACSGHYKITGQSVRCLKR